MRLPSTNCSEGTLSETWAHLRRVPPGGRGVWLVPVYVPRRFSKRPYSERSISVCEKRCWQWYTCWWINCLSDRCQPSCAGIAGGRQGKPHPKGWSTVAAQYSSSYLKRNIIDRLLWCWTSPKIVDLHPCPRHDCLYGLVKNGREILIHHHRCGRVVRQGPTRPCTSTRCGSDETRMYAALHGLVG